MAEATRSDDYEAGYADGVRDAAAWTAKRAAEIPGQAARRLRDDAQTRWAQWSDRRNWPSVRALVASARRGGGGCDATPEGKAASDG